MGFARMAKRSIITRRENGNWQTRRYNSTIQLDDESEETTKTMTAENTEPEHADERESRELSPIKITLISLHGLIRGHDCELGRDADTGGQVKYVLELARELAAQPMVREVE